MYFLEREYGEIVYEDNKTVNETKAFYKRLYWQQNIIAMELNMLVVELKH